jgi:hypothetical protein
MRETLKGKIVLVTGFWHHRDMVPISDEVKEMIDRMTCDKIAMAHEVIVVDPHGYVGESTTEQIAFARAQGKPISFESAKESK